MKPFIIFITALHFIALFATMFVVSTYKYPRLRLHTVAEECFGITINIAVIV